MIIQSLHKDIDTSVGYYLNADVRSRLAEISREFYQKYNNGKVWQTLGLGNFVNNDKFLTMREMFTLSPDISTKVMDAAMTKFAETLPIETTETNKSSSSVTWKWNHLFATTGEWRILLELIKRGTLFPKEKKLQGFQNLVEHYAREKGVSDIYIVMHKKGLLTNIKQPRYHSGVYQGFLTAAEHGHVESLEVMQRDFDIIDRDKERAFYSAACLGQLSILKFLSQNVQNLFLFHYEDALLGAAKNGHLTSVNYLLQGRVFYNHDIGEAIKKAKEKGHVDVVDVLFQRYIANIYVRDNPIDWGFALKNSVEQRLTEVVKYIAPYAGFPYYYISKEDYRSAMDAAQDDPEMIQLLSQESRWATTAKIAACAVVFLIIRNKLGEG